MLDQLRRFAVPAYLLAAMLLGGSVQGIWSNLALQLLAIGLIIWAALAEPRRPVAAAPRMLMLLTAAALALFVLQLVPLSPSLWSSLPGRHGVAEGFRQLQLPLPALPLSLAPYLTLATALTLLPPIAVLTAMFRIGSRDQRLVAGVVLVGVLANTLLGAIQLASGTGDRWRLYEITNSGVVGFFANRNHLGTLLVLAIPFAAALFATSARGSSDRGSTARARRLGVSAVGAAGFVLLLFGILLNGSLAALALSVPVAAASILILPGSWRFRALAVPIAAIATVVAVVALAVSPVQDAAANATSVTSRAEMWRKTTAAVADTFPVGTGLGTFAQVYRQYEDPASVRNTYVNHAHNDYLELVLETGAAGLLLLLLFLAWWTANAVRVWRSALSSHFARAATIASAAVLAHSVVDYPLRTAAIATLFAASLALMAQPPRSRRTAEPSEVRPTKHVVVG